MWPHLNTGQFEWLQLSAPNTVGNKLVILFLKKPKSDGLKLNDGALGQAVSSELDTSTNQIKQTLSSSSYSCMCGKEVNKRSREWGDGSFLSKETENGGRDVALCPPPQSLVVREESSLSLFQSVSSNSLSLSVSLSLECGRLHVTFKLLFSLSLFLPRSLLYHYFFLMLAWSVGFELKNPTAKNRTWTSWKLALICLRFVKDVCVCECLCVCVCVKLH